MGIEIERKFLVRGQAWRAEAKQRLRIAQAYLGGDLASVRVRIQDDAANLNIKSKTLGIRRQEFEYPIPLADAEAMFAQLASRRIEKFRHLVEINGQCFEIDEFLGDNSGLCVAEIELSDECSDYPKPPWLGREVSSDPRYFNIALVEAPFSSWPDRQDILKELAAC